MKSKETKPFVYLVGWISKRKYYVGVKYGKGCSPECLGKTYFTSSKYAKALWKEQPPDFMDTYLFDSAEQALKAELMLQQHYDVLHNMDFINRAIAGARYRISETLIRQIAAKNKGKKRKPMDPVKRAELSARMSALNKGRSPPNKGKPMTQAQKDHLSRVNTGKKLPPRSKRHLDNLRQAFERPIQTPFGVFDSRKKAAQAIGIAASTLGWRIEKYPAEYYYI